MRVAATIRELEALQNFVLAKCTFGAADPTALLQLAAKERGEREREETFLQ